MIANLQIICVMIIFLFIPTVHPAPKVNHFINVVHTEYMPFNDYLTKHKKAQ